MFYQRMQFLIRQIFPQIIVSMSYNQMFLHYNII